MLAQSRCINYVTCLCVCYYYIFNRQNAGGRDSDHFHEGVGFLAQHFKLSRRLENSIQTMHPSLALPYWDTSIEMEKVRKREIPGVTDAVLWTSKFFGKSGKWHRKKSDGFDVRVCMRRFEKIKEECKRKKRWGD